MSRVSIDHILELPTAERVAIVATIESLSSRFCIRLAIHKHY